MLGKIVFNDGMDVLSFVTTRGVLTVIVFWLWLRAAPPARRHTRRERLVSIAIGVMFAANMFASAAGDPAAAAVDRDPDLFHLSAADRPRRGGDGDRSRGLAGFVAALAAFIGLAMMLGARLGDVELLGVASAVAAAVPARRVAADHPRKPA